MQFTEELWPLSICKHCPICASQIRIELSLLPDIFFIIFDKESLKNNIFNYYYKFKFNKKKI